MLETWGKVPEYGGRGAPPKLPKPGKDWQYLQIIKKRKGGKVESVRIKIIYGDPEEVKAKLGCHTAYIERTNLTSRTMNGRLVRKTLPSVQNRRLIIRGKGSSSIPLVFKCYKIFFTQMAKAIAGELLALRVF